MNFFLEN